METAYDTMPGASSGYLASNVTKEEIRAFKTSLVARRFPGLQDLSDDVIRELIAANRAAGGATPQLKQKHHPKTGFNPPSPKRKDPQFTQSSPKFVPCNPHEAKAAIWRPPEQAYSGIYSPYESDHQDFAEYMKADTLKVVADVPFSPACPSQAKQSIHVDSYLNSADAEMKALEKEATMQRVQQNMGTYKSLYRSRRGTTLVPLEQTRKPLDD